jgi:hypothetical protein
MTTSYTPEMKLPLQEDGGYNWGAIINGVLELLDKGFELTFTFGESVSAGDVVAIKTEGADHGKIYKAASGDSTLTPAIGIAPSAVTSGNEGKVRHFGWIDIDTSYAAGVNPSWSPGEYAYVDDVAGRLTKSWTDKPDAVGFSKSWTDANYNTRFVIMPQHPYDARFGRMRLDADVHFDAEYDNGNSGASLAIDWANGNKQKVTLTDALTLKLVQDAGGTNTVTWPATVKWASGTAPTLTAAGDAIDLIALHFDGTNYYGSAVLNLS